MVGGGLVGWLIGGRCGPRKSFGSGGPKAVSRGTQFVSNCAPRR